MYLLIYFLYLEIDGMYLVAVGACLLKQISVGATPCGCPAIPQDCEQNLAGTGACPYRFFGKPNDGLVISHRHALHDPVAAADHLLRVNE